MTSAAPVTVRKASADDAKEVHSLILELAEHMSAREKVGSSVEDIRAALLGSEPAVHALMAEQDGHPVGVAIFFLSFSTWRGSNGVYLQDVYVRPNMRTTGTGRKLISRVVAWAADHGADHLRLSVDTDNIEARSFYEHLNLLHRDDEMIYQISGNSFSQLGKKE